MLAPIWGVFIWKDLAHASKGTNRLPGLMFLFSITRRALIVLAKTR